MPHFFNDILSLNCTGTFRDKDSYQTKRRKICRSVLLPTQLCNTHSHTDSESDWCTVPSPDYGCSGLPCTDMSRAGRQLKKHGPTNSVYMTHGKYVETKEVPIFTVECTPESRLSNNNNNCIIYQLESIGIILLFLTYLTVHLSPSCYYSGFHTTRTSIPRLHYPLTIDID